MKKIITILTAFVITTQLLYAQVDTINTQTNKLLLKNLEEGTTKYLVYTADSLTGEIHYSDIWVRSVAFTNFHSMPVVQFSWQWYRHDSLYKYVTDYCDNKTLAPLYSYTSGRRMGTLAYNYNNCYMVAADTVANNKANPATKIALDVPTLDWQWDMEVFELLQYKKVGQQFAIAFYDPNDINGKPQYYMHTVIGDEDLVLNKEVKTRCWLLRIDYNKETYAIFWISKKTHEMLKMKSYYRGMYRYKVRLY